MIRVRDDAAAPVNDNLATANDNKRTEYMREYMARRRQGAKTMRSLLKDSLALIEAGASMHDPEAQTFIAAVREILAHEEPRQAKHDRSGG